MKLSSVTFHCSPITEEPCVLESNSTCFVFLRVAFDLLRKTHRSTSPTTSVRILIVREEFLVIVTFIEIIGGFCQFDGTVYVEIVLN